MERISKYQLLTLTIFFQVGTTVIFGFGASAGKDAWIVSSMSTILGLIMIGIYLVIYHYNPGLTLVEWFPAQLGKWIGTPIAWLYPLLCLYEVGRILNDIKFLITSTVLPLTPFWAVIILFTLLIAYSQICGIEVLGRVGELSLSLFLLLFILEIILIFIGGEIDVLNLLPVLDKGWKPILHATWPLGASQGFAQTLEMAMIWSLVGSAKNITKTTIFATIISGFIITIGNLLAITTLGEVFFQHQSFPLYVIIQEINIGELIKNLDAIGIIYFTLTAFFKIALHMLFAIKGISKLTKIQDERKLLLPAITISLYLGYSVASNFTEHIQVALEVFPYNLWILLLWVLPLILFIVTLFRNIVIKKFIS